ATLLGKFADASAQELADSLAPFYPVAETARAVWTHFSSSVPRAGDMAAILIPAYTRASKPLHAADMAGALAPFYPAPATSTVLKTHYAGDIANATAMATLLQTAYTAAGTALTPQIMATALTGAPYAVAETAVAMRAAFPAQTDTASKMAGYLYNASVPAPGSAAMAAALAGVPYPADQVAAAIHQYYQQDVGSALKMAQLLAPSYPADQIAAPLHATYPAETATPDALYAILVTAYQPATIAAPVMAGAFARAPYTAVAAAPALRTKYPAVTQTATDMATLLVAAYVTPGIDARTTARALAASPYDVAGTTAALLAKFAADMQTAASAAQILAQSPYPASAVGPQLRTSYETATRQASAMTSILAQAPYAAAEVAPVLRTLYPADTATPANMDTLLAASYTLTAPLMAHALAVSPYPAPQVAPVLRTNYAADTATPGAMQQLLAAAYAPQQLDAQTMAAALARSPYAVLLVVPVLRASYAADTNTAQKLGRILHTAYSGILLTDLLSALAAAPYNALDNTPVLVSLYTPLATDLATALVAVYPGSAALSSLQLGVALGAGAYDSAKIAAGIHQGIPSTSVGVMAVALLLAQSSTVASAISAAQGFRTAGDTAPAAAPKIVQALPAIKAYELAAALTSVFTPPNLTSTGLANLLAATWTTPLPGDVASAVLANFPTLQPSPLLSLLQSAWTAAGKALDQNGGAAALAQGYRYIGGSVTMTQVAQLLIASYPTSATVDSIARSLASGYGLTANTRDATQLLTALREGFAGTAIRLDATIATSAATAALALTPGQAAIIATAASQAFSLTRSPNDVGALAVAMRVAAFQQAATLEAFASVFNPWNATAQQIATTAFTSAAWQQAYTLEAGGQTVQAAAPAIHTRHPATGEVDMVRMLAATWYYLTTATAVRPIAEAMKAANYTLSQCAYGMNQQYSPDWTPADYQVVAAVYKGGNDVTRPVTDRSTGNTTVTIAAIVEDAGNLNDAAYGCRIAGFDPIPCAPQLKQTYPSASATEMAIALGRGWAGIINTPTMTSALTAAPYPAADVQAAVAAIVHLNLVDNSLYPDPQVSTMQRALALTQGDLTKLTAGELVDFLVVSCLPGDYSPTQGSLVGALAAIGVSVQQLSASKAADYRANYHCWISQPVPGQNFTQLLVFESTGQNAVQNIPGILLGVQAFMPTPHAGSNYPYANVATSMVSTGSGGAQPNAVLTALFNSAKGVMKSAYDLGSFRIDIYAAAQVPPLQTLFGQLKAQ
ncbi:MAG TPA: hypothetical protein VND45_17360, partial [Thermoanaerobaculia bacterium]|nr:hypothetical protein [Thermoanaerobaculia bacterium]